MGGCSSLGASRCSRFRARRRSGPSGTIYPTAHRPDGYRIPPHYHPAIEHITVIQGTFVVGMGEKADRAAEKSLEAGSFAFMPAGMRHFVRAQGDTIVQLHGTGPCGITYVNPSDDPRKKQE